DDVPPEEVSAFYARQIFSLGDEALNRRLEAVWGKLRNTPEEKVTLIQAWQEKLTPSVLAAADPAHGQTVFERTCSSCHSMRGRGGNLGPELDGANRRDLFYLLENIIDPSAVLPQDYRMNIFTLKDGRTLSGTVSAETRHTVTLAMLDRVEVIPVSEIESRQVLEQSIMPEGLIQSLKDTEVQDLMAFLQQ
ncbi:MAG: c-type cytochrome, partial [Verrucomicrobiae bacterium]|nr:c-type cytochrome [Verrucomicrobiae bacterium]